MAAGAAVNTRAQRGGILATNAQEPRNGGAAWVRASEGPFRRACMAAAAALCLLAGGCTSNPVPVEVQVPVPVACRVETPARPVLPLDGVDVEGAGLFEITRALLSSFERLSAHVLKLEAALEGCRRID